MTHRRGAFSEQLGLFGPRIDRPSLCEVYAAAEALVRVLPEGLSFGTSSWSFPGWHGTVYCERRTETELARDGLREYARHPLLTCVGIDRGYYQPIRAVDLERYASQVPRGFRCFIKAPASVTAPTITHGSRSRPPVFNNDFLSPVRFERDVLDEIETARFADHLGAIVIEVSPTLSSFRPEPRVFARRLDALLSVIPDALPVAVELRDRALITDDYVNVLRRRRAAHVYSHWAHMPSISAQRRLVPLSVNPFVIVRLLLPPGAAYEARRRQCEPFDRLIDRDPAMRAEVIALVREALGASLRAYVLVNNKAEGSSPLTISELAALYASTTAR